MARLLIPLDGTERSYQVIDAVFQVVRPEDVEVTLLVTAPDHFGGAPEDVAELLEDAGAGIVATATHRDEVIAEGTRRLAAHGRTPTVWAGHEDPLKEILTACKEHDLLAMHELDPTRRAARWHGSHGGPIARQAGCHVLLVKTS